MPAVCRRRSFTVMRGLARSSLVSPLVAAGLSPQFFRRSPFTQTSRSSPLAAVLSPAVLSPTVLLLHSLAAVLSPQCSRCSPLAPQSYLDMDK